MRLGGDAIIRLRATTTFEVEEASARVARQMAAMIAGSADAARLATLIPDFDIGDMADENRLAAVQRRLLLIDLVALCNDGWSGIVDADDNPLPSPPEPAWIALLLDDPGMAAACERAVYARVHEEVAEGNALPASPHGGAQAGNAPAPTAVPVAPPAASAA